MWEKAEKQYATISTKDAKFRRFSTKMQSINVCVLLALLMIISVVTSIAGKLQPGEYANITLNALYQNNKNDNRVCGMKIRYCVNKRVRVSKFFSFVYLLKLIRQLKLD